MVILFPFEVRERIHRILDRFMIVVAIIVVVSLVSEYGFYLPSDYLHRLHVLDFLIIAIFILHQLIRLMLAVHPFQYLKSRWFDFLLIVLLLSQLGLAAGLFDIRFYREWLETLSIQDVTKVYIVIAQLYLVLDLVMKGARYSRNLARLKFQPAQMLALSFLAVITIGTLLLLLPRASTNGSMSFIDALFTATSASCVTGLIVVDTPTYFTTFGQLVILGLVQVGGLGIMTFTTFFLLFFGGGIGIRERVLMQEFLSEKNVGKIVHTLWLIIVFTMVSEGIGAAVLYYFWDGGAFASTIERIYYSIFHSISAFCNAGFSLFSSNLLDQQVGSNAGILLTVAVLVIVGGIGYPVVIDLLGYRKTLSGRLSGRHHLTAHSKLVLITTGALLALGTLVVLGLEWGNTLEDFGLAEKFLQAFFHSVSTRTVGFNSIEVGGLLISTSFFLMLLMFIGASPASTGGGIKTTTFSVGLITITSVAMGKDRVEVFKRQISDVTIFRAYATIMLAGAVIATSVFILSATENAPLLDILFEEVSAFSTVGLSRGVTPHLSPIGKLVITCTMFIGRVGPLTLALALSKRIVTTNYQYPQEHVIVV